MTLLVLLGGGGVAATADIDDSPYTKVHVQRIYTHRHTRTHMFMRTGLFVDPHTLILLSSL